MAKVACSNSVLSSAWPWGNSSASRHLADVSGAAMPGSHRPDAVPFSSRSPCRIGRSALLSTTASAAGCRSEIIMRRPPQGRLNAARTTKAGKAAGSIDDARAVRPPDRHGVYASSANLAKAVNDTTWNQTAGANAAEQARSLAAGCPQNVQRHDDETR